MAKIFEFYPGQGSLKNQVSGDILSHTGVLLKRGTKGREAMFDGTQISVSASNQYNANSFSIIAWIFFSDPMYTSLDIIGKWDTTGNQRSWVLTTFETRLSFFASSNGVNIASMVLNDPLKYHQWYWCAVTKDDSIVTLYLNNIVPPQTQSNVFSSIFQNTAILTLGGRGQTPAELASLYGSLAYAAYFNHALSAAELTTAYNQYLRAQVVEKPIFFADRFTPGASGNALIAIDGVNWDADGVSKTAGRIGDFVIGSGTFACTEDVTGKLITCSVNGTLQIIGIDLSLWTGNGYVQQIDGSLSAANANMTVNDAPALTFSNNTLTITMTAGQTIRNLVIARGA